MNFGESRTVTLSEMIRVVGEVFERDPVVEEHSLQPGDALRTYADTSRGRPFFVAAGSGFGVRSRRGDGPDHAPS